MKRDFTIIEMLVVISIIALLAGAVGTVAVKSRKNARQRQAEGDITAIYNAIMQYKFKFGDFPRKILQSGDKGDLTIAFVKGTLIDKGKVNLALLPDQLSGSSNDGVKDPFGNPYQVSIAKNRGTIVPADAIFPRINFEDKDDNEGIGDSYYLTIWSTGGKPQKSPNQTDDQWKSEWIYERQK